MKTSIAMLIFCFGTSTLSAETFNLTPQTSDAEVGPSGSFTTGTTARAGLTGSFGYGRNPVYIFAFPKIAFGDKITGASFSAYLSSFTGTPTFNGDLYSLGSSTSTTTAAADYFNGTFGTDTNSTALQQHFVAPTSTIGTISASSTGNAAIAADLDAWRAAGYTAGSYYLLRVSPDFTGSPWNTYLGYNMSMTEDSSHQPALSVTTTTPAQLGRVLIEYWTGIPYSPISALTSNANYPNKPSAREYSAVMEIPQNLDVSSGDRLRGYFYPPTTGSYTFAIASDDNSILLFSTDGNPAHATQIASVSGNTGYQQWNKYTSQISTPIALTAGQVCYIESLHKQGSGGSNLSIGWQPPGAGSIALMPTTNVAPYDASAVYTSGAAAAIVAQSHPRLMLSAAAIARLKAAIAVPGSIQATWWSAIQTQANTMGAQGPVATIVPNPADLSFVNAARALQDRVYYLGLDYLLNTNTTVQANCLNQIYAELQSQTLGQSAANWGGTNNNTAPGNWNLYAFLDVSEISHAYAIAYDWCYNGWTSTQSSNLLNTMVTNGFGPGLTEYASGFGGGSGNWPIVCDAGLIFSAMAILGDETSSPKAPTILDDYVPRLYGSTAMAEWSPDGAWPEAPTYWLYSMRYLTTMFASLETSAGTCFNFDKLSGLSAAGSARLYGIGPINKTFNYGDEGSEGVEHSSGDQFLGLKYNQPVYSWSLQQHAIPYPTDLVWYDPRGATATPSSLGLPTSTYFRNAGIINLRSAWNDSNALFAGMKAGFNTNSTPYGSGHEQLEIGSFVFDALGVRWASDLGRDNYSNIYFTLTPSVTMPNRWQYYRCRCEGNNTLVINPGRDGGQCLNGTATLTNFKSTSSPNVQQAIIDMSNPYATDMYNSPTVTTNAKRGLRFVQATNVSQMVAQIQDEVTTTSSATVNLYWFMHTTTTISTSGNTATLTSGNNRLLLTIRSPSTATFSSTAAVPFSWSPDGSNFPNSSLPGPEIPTTGYNKLRIAYAIPSGAQSTTIQVDMCPYVQGNTIPIAPTAPPLSSW